MDSGIEKATGARGIAATDLLQQGVKKWHHFRMEPELFKRSDLIQATKLSERAIFLAAAFRHGKCPFTGRVNVQCDTGAPLPTSYRLNATTAAHLPPSNDDSAH